MLSSGNGWDQPFDFGLGNLGAVISGANAGPGERVMITNPELAAIFGRPVGQTINYDSLSDPQRAAMLEEERQRHKRMEEMARKELQNKFKKMAMYTAGLATAGYTLGAGGALAPGSSAAGSITAGTGAGAGAFTPLAVQSPLAASGLAAAAPATTGAAVAGGGALAANAIAPLAVQSPLAASGIAAAAPAAVASTGGATVAGIGGGASGWLSGAMKWSLANKNWISGLLTAVGTAYSQSNQKKLARQQYDYANSVLQQQRDYYAQQQEAIRNSPAARMAGPLMDAVLQMYAERLGRYNVNLPLQEILGGIRQATGRG